MTVVNVDHYLHRLMTNLPEELLTQGKFVVWEGRLRASGRLGKVPVAPSGTGGWCTVNASDNRFWLNWEQAARCLRSHTTAAGLALVLSRSGLVVIDLDDSVTWAAGEPLISSEALQVLRALGWPTRGYLELSPSGRGLHLIGRASLASGPRRRPGVELLDSGIATLTGQALPGGGELSLPEQAMRELQAGWTVTAISDTRQRPNLRSHSRRTDRTDTQLLTRAKNARNGAKFRRLFDFGDVFSDHLSRSEGVASLISLLLYWCDGDLARAERLYRTSSLYRPDLDDRPAGPDGRTRLQLTLARVHNWRRQF